MAYDHSRIVCMFSLTGLSDAPEATMQLIIFLHKVDAAPQASGFSGDMYVWRLSWGFA